MGKIKYEAVAGIKRKIVSIGIDADEKYNLLKLSVKREIYKKVLYR
jgi:hypothetical protein